MTTQTRHPWKATIRTSLAVFLTVAGILPLITTILGEEIGGIVGPDFISGFGVFVGVVTAFAAAITRIMAIPAVDTLLTRIGLGAAPKAEGRE